MLTINPPKLLTAVLMEARSNPKGDITIRRARELRQSATDAERKLWGGLRNRTLMKAKFKRQFPIAGYIADFCCPEHKLVVEIDGSQHLEQMDYDDARTRAIEAKGYRVIRFWNTDALKETDAVLDAIARTLTAPSPARHGSCKKDAVTAPATLSRDQMRARGPAGC